MSATAKILPLPSPGTEPSPDGPPDGSGTGSRGEADDARAPSAGASNDVHRVVREFIELHDAMEEIRADLRARGVPLRATGMLVDLGLQQMPEKQAAAMQGVLERVEREQGSGTLDRGTLETRIEEIVSLEQDRKHARQIARGRGLDPRSLAILSQLIQSNPGDGGEHAVNRILAYARACDIALDGVPEMAAELTAPTVSVLPQIDRGQREEDEAWSRGEMIRDVATGLLIGTFVILALV